MEERRTECQLHPGLQNQINLILTNQTTYMGQQSDIVSDITYIKTTLDNGLKSKVNEAHKSIEELKQKIDVLDDFAWFREWICDFRNKLFKRLVMLAIGGGLVVSISPNIYSYAQKMIKAVLE